MNKKRLQLKHRNDTVRISHEPDYDHDAWTLDVQPTPESVPDAFYERREDALPRKSKPETRRKPHRSVTTSMLRRRLYSAGVKGEEAQRILAEIMAGEQKTDGLAIPMSWSVKGFRERFGKRITRAVLRFVHIALIMIDEAWTLLQSPAATAYIERGFKSARNFSAATQYVVQTMPVIPKTVARHISFHH